MFRSQPILLFLPSVLWIYDIILSHILQLLNDQGTPNWKPVFIALTDKDMLMYDTVPWSKEEWATPFQSHPLLATRYLP